MPNYLGSYSSSSSSRRANSSFLIIIGVVALLHLLLLALGTLWHPAPPKLKAKPKVVVQTISLQPFQSSFSEPRSSPSLSLQPPTESFVPPLPLVAPVVEPPSVIPPSMELINEEIPVKNSPLSEERETFKVEKVAVNQQLPPPAEIISPPVIPTPVKVESQPKPSPPSPKVVPQEPIKKTVQPAAPVKKGVETPKAVNKPVAKPDPSKLKQIEETKKKEEEKKQQLAKIEAQKKIEQEKIETEKRRQREAVAEAERKRKEEIAAQELAKKKAAEELARQKMASAHEKLAKLNESRGKIASSSSVNLESAPLPKELLSLHVDALPLEGAGKNEGWSTKEASYSEGVAFSLKRHLKLPDYGAVKVKLTLNRLGGVESVEIIQSESTKNQAYVKSEIPKIKFLPFGQNFEGVSQNTFVITLKNDS